MKIKLIKSIKFNGSKNNPELNINMMNNQIIDRFINYYMIGDDPLKPNSAAIYNTLIEVLNSKKFLDNDYIISLEIGDNCDIFIVNDKITLNIFIQKFIYTNDSYPRSGYYKRVPANVSIDIELIYEELNLKFIDKMIEGHKLIFSYYNDKLIAYQCNEKCSDRRISLNGFDESKIIKGLNKKFQAQKLAGIIEKEYLDSLEELNKKLSEKYGVTLKCLRTNSMSIVKDGRSIKSIVIKQ